MNASLRVLLAAAGLATMPCAAQAKVHITVDLSKQMMHVETADATYDWPVSSGKFGFETPNGTYGVLWTDKDHHSQEYDNAPMPDAIFFRPGYAIHGAYKSDFGHPASHGCVRLPVARAALLFDLVQAEGAQIKIIGESPKTIQARKSSHPPAAPAEDPDATAMGTQDDGLYAPEPQPDTRQAYTARGQAYQAYPPPGYVPPPGYAREDRSGDSGDTFFRSLFSPN